MQIFDQNAGLIFACVSLSVALATGVSLIA